MFSSAIPIFQTYLLPSLPFRRRNSSSASSSASTSSPTSPASPIAAFPSASTSPLDSIQEQPFLSGSQSSISCSRCHADLAMTSQIISKGFTGRHGRAYLVAPNVTAAVPASVGALPNTHTHKAVPRHLVTGLHTVCDVSCAVCGSVLGWKYVGAEDEGQRYKVGKFILESRRTIVASSWEADDDTPIPPNKLTQEEEEVMFDSQDEDECEELFAGVWTAHGAKKRRARRVARG